MLLSFILATTLLSGCGLSEYFRDQLEDAVGKAAGEALDSAITKTAKAVDKVSTTIDKHGSAQGILDKIISFIDNLLGDSENECEKQTVKKEIPNPGKVIVKRNAEQQNYHEDIGKPNEHLHIQLRSGTYNKNEIWRCQNTVFNHRILPG